MSSSSHTHRPVNFDFLKQTKLTKSGKKKYSKQILDREENQMLIKLISKLKVVAHIYNLRKRGNKARGFL